MYVGESLTDAGGVAQDYWTLGADPGDNVLEVRSALPTTTRQELHGTITATGVIPAPEVCNGADDDHDGTIDDPAWSYCMGGAAALNTDGRKACIGGYADLDAQAANGCERLLDGRWEVSPALTLHCPSLPAGLTTFTVSEFSLRPLSPTQFALNPVLKVFDLFPAALETGITGPAEPGAPGFSSRGPFILPVTFVPPGVTASGNGTFSVSGAFTSPLAMQATVKLDFTVELLISGISFPSSCNGITTTVTAARIGR